MKPAHEIIKELRTKNRLSQKELAEKIGTSQQAIALLENGKRKIDFDLFIRILEELKEPLVNIINLSENDLDTKIGMSIASQTDSVYENIVKLCGAYLYFSDETIYDGIILKYKGHSINITDEEYENLRRDIFSHTSYLIHQLVQKHIDPDIE